MEEESKSRMGNRGTHRNGARLRQTSWLLLSLRIHEWDAEIFSMRVKKDGVGRYGGRAVNTCYSC